VFGATPAEQIAFVRAAAERGADWVILQPPQPPAGEAGAPPTEDQLVDFFGAVADASPLPVAIQNAPQYIGVGLSGAGIDRLCRDHPNVRLLKAEGSAVETRSLIELSGDRLAVFQGRGGMEFIDVMRAGCVGLIPSVESCHVQSRMFELLQSGRAEDEAEAERLYAKLAPLIVFLMQSIGQFLCYGKRLTGRRLGLGEVHDRQPAQAPTAFGFACLERHAAVLDQLP
jgi:4-hydroxy-tetrahydrodipicolinate synthase